MRTHIRVFIIVYFRSNMTRTLERKRIYSKFHLVQYQDINDDLLKAFSLCWYIKGSFNGKFSFLSNVKRRPGKYSLFFSLLCLSCVRMIKKQQQTTEKLDRHRTTSVGRALDF